MRAVVYQGPRRVAVEQVPDPRIEQPTDVVIRVTSSAICGSDLHMYEGRTAAEPGMVRYNHELRDLILAGRAQPGFVVSERVPLEQAPQAYEPFDRREEGWSKVVLDPAA